MEAVPPSPETLNTWRIVCRDCGAASGLCRSAFDAPPVIAPELCCPMCLSRDLAYIADVDEDEFYL